MERIGSMYFSQIAIFIAVLEVKVGRKGTHRKKDGVLISVYRMSSWHSLITRVGMLELSFVVLKTKKCATTL